MKLLLKLIMVIFTVLTYQSATASSVSDADEFLSMFDSAKCIECHEDIDPSRMHSSHEGSVINKQVINAVNQAMVQYTRTNARNTVKKCFSCHAPQISSASDGLVDHFAVLVLIAANDDSAERKNNALDKLSQLNLNCRICHMINAAPDNIEASNIIRGPGWDEHEHSHKEEYGFDTFKSDYVTTAQFCKSCHSGYEHQFDGSENLVAQVKCISNDAASKNCQDCHIDIDHSFSKAKQPVK